MRLNSLCISVQTLMIAAIAAASSQQPLHDYRIPSKHEPITLQTPLNIEQRSEATFFKELIQIGIENHLPLGIVIDDHATMCEKRLPPVEEKTTVSKLIDSINANLTGYHAQLENGVLTIIPIDIAPAPAHLLNLMLPEFQSDSQPHHRLGENLWMFVRAVIAPTEGTISGGPSSFNVERVPGMKLNNVTVRTALDKIVDEGSGGMWIFHTSIVHSISDSTQKPYEVYGYIGQENRLRNDIPCRVPDDLH